MNRNLVKSVMITIASAVLTTACATGAELLKRSLSSPSINVTQPLLTVRKYDDHGHVEHEALLNPNSKAAKRLQAIIDGSGWRPTLVTYAPGLHFRPEAGADFTIDVSPTRAVANFETLGIKRQKVRTIDADEYQALLNEVYTSAEPILKLRKKENKAK
jgi:hypothetical protein